MNNEKVKERNCCNADTLRGNNLPKAFPKNMWPGQIRYVTHVTRAQCV